VDAGLVGPGGRQRLGFEPKELLDKLDTIPPAPASSLTAVRDADEDEENGRE